MIVLKTTDIRNDFKKISNLVRTGEKILVSRPHNENLVILSEKEYNELEKLAGIMSIWLKLKDRLNNFLKAAL